MPSPTLFVGFLAAAATEPASASPTLLIIGITLAAFVLVSVGMAVGVMFGRRPISGSCGGVASVTGEDGETKCSLCEDPSAACKELRRQMDESQGSAEA